MEESRRTTADPVAAHLLQSGETNFAFEQDMSPLPHESRSSITTPDITVTMSTTATANNDDVIEILPGYMPAPAATFPQEGAAGPSPSTMDVTTTVPRHSSFARHRKQCAECCLHCIVLVTSLRFLLIAMALLGAGAVVAGIVLGALNMMAGNNFLTLSLLFIGLGVVMVIVVGVAWRCAPLGHEPCHRLCNISQLPTDESAADSTRFPRLQNRRNQWHGGMLYPEFEYGVPPPPYTVTVVGDQSPPVVVDNHNDFSNATIDDAAIRAAAAGLDDDISLPSSRPPSYRSHASMASLRPTILPPPLAPSPFLLFPPPDYPQFATEISTDPLVLNSDASCGSLIATATDFPVAPTSSTERSVVNGKTFSVSEFRLDLSSAGNSSGMVESVSENFARSTLSKGGSYMTEHDEHDISSEFYSEQTAGGFGFHTDAPAAASESCRSTVMTYCKNISDVLESGDGQFITDRVGISDANVEQQSDISRSPLPRDSETSATNIGIDCVDCVAGIEAVHRSPESPNSHFEQSFC